MFNWKKQWKEVATASVVFLGAFGFWLLGFKIPIFHTIMAAFVVLVFGFFPYYIIFSEGKGG